MISASARSTVGAGSLAMPMTVRPGPGCPPGPLPNDDVVRHPALGISDWPSRPCVIALPLSPPGE